jgi:hypothetical protein
MRETGVVMVSGRGRYTMPAMAALAVFILLNAASCGPGRATAADTINAYLQAVQTEDLDALYCLSAGAAVDEGGQTQVEEARKAFSGWARSEFEAYFSGRDEGQLDLTSSGIVLVKAFTLGKPIRFAYGDINIAGLRPGTTFYVCGYPLGAMHSVTIPRRPGEERREVLNAIVVRWTLVRQEDADGCGERWTVNTVEPVPGTERNERLVWVF